MKQARAAVGKLTKPIERFLALEASSGIILIAAALVAFLWANSPWSEDYFHMKHVELGLEFGFFSLFKSAEHWVNDGLMVIFFFVVGLEIKRELIVGELAGWRRAALPAFAALGGMVAPALIYVAFNTGDAFHLRGWGVPMATDIAFAVGVLALVGNRVSLALKVFLLALAIVDDLGAVLVIAIFYTESVDIAMLALSLAIWAIAVLYGRENGGRPSVFLALGVLCWYFMYKSGVHATIAGVLMALAVPLRHALPSQDLKDALKMRIGEGDFEEVEVKIEHLEDLLEQSKSPLHSFEHALQPWVAYLIMPIFALFNAGVAVSGGEGDLFTLVTLGCFLGLLIGKPVGVLGTVWIGVKLRILELRPGIEWNGMLGVGFLAGIGFTMALFVANLAFGASPELDQAKIGVLLASLAAAVAGLMVLRRLPPRDAG